MSDRLSKPLPAFQPARLTAFDPAAPTPAVTASLGPFPLARRLLSVWQGWADGRTAPDRMDIDPVTMPDLLPNIVMLDVLDDDFRFRLLGETINRRFGHGLKGRTLSEQMRGRSLDETFYEHRRCAEDLRGVLVRNTLDVACMDDVTLYTRLLLPAEIRNGRATVIIGIMEFYGVEVVNDTGDAHRSSRKPS